jgi:hypothetical protein
MRINIALAALSWACCIATSHAQVGVGTTTPQAAFDVTSTTQGMLIPRVALTSRTVQAPVVNPQGGNVVTSTLIYNTATAGTAPNNVIPGFYYWNGTQWIAIAGSATPPASDAWLVTGNAGTSAATHFVGTTDDVDLVFRTNGNKKFTMASGTNQILAGASGAVSSPTYSWEASPNYGMYMASGTNIRVATAGVARFQFPNANQVHAMADGSGALPFYSWTNATGTGMFKTGNTTAAQLGFATNALERLRITQAGNVGVGTTTPATILEVAGALSLEEGTALALVNGVNNNVALGTTPYSLYRITGPTAQFSLTGIVPATAANGQLVTLENTTAHNMILVHQSGGSTAGNQFLIPGAENLTLKGQYATVTLQYNATQQKWIVKSYAGAAQQATPQTIYAVRGTTDITKNSVTHPNPRVYTDMEDMTLTFTPKGSVVYVNFSAAGDLNTNVMPISNNILFQLVNTSAPTTPLAGMISVTSDFAEYNYGYQTAVASGWNVGLNMYPLPVTPGVPITLKIQWAAQGIVAGAANNLCATGAHFSHRSFTIIDP